MSDMSANRLAPSRRIEVRPNHAGHGFLFVAVQVSADGGRKETLLNVAKPATHDTGFADLPEMIARCVESLTGVAFSYPEASHA